MTITKHSKVLIVDDSKAVRGAVRKILSQLGYNDIDEAVDGSDALEKNSAAKYGLVISDWNMEPMNGQTLLEKLRAQDRFANLPVIMMTSEPTVEKVITAKHAHVSCFIIKPFGPETLKAKISEINAR